MLTDPRRRARAGRRRRAVARYHRRGTSDKAADQCLGASIVAALPVGLWAGPPLKPQAFVLVWQVIACLALAGTRPALKGSWHRLVVIPFVCDPGCGAHNCGGE